ncbi:hypothetical protein PTSG_03874 [Salpingoeca rosetta]|uniref:TNFR-Cys domain-containing protein n=1 Tax=Salpingoeca rosetta (strain ATCC 50818 / BSB-021) TaxID=946362 RepID=F2U5M7_SALR5|nr:uncharacterized protein PTSG_03874 [Salpingoeca rosetta]EGD83243.1 hypothetical protein PTSG_03874 [Salpingoeca rosetta]|eukprot:XP_004995607.1 hypothetical protein PTSG_03874 [Salpingoeca rosetta]
MRLSAFATVASIAAVILGLTSAVTAQDSACEWSRACPVSLRPSTSVLVAVQVSSVNDFINERIDLDTGAPATADEVHVQFRNNMILTGANTTQSVTFYSPAGRAIAVSEAAPAAVAFLASEQWISTATTACLCHAQPDATPLIDVANYATIRVHLDLEFMVDRTPSCALRFENTTRVWTVDASLYADIAVNSSTTALRLQSIDCGNTATPTAVRFTAVAARPCDIPGCVACKQDGVTCAACFNPATLASPDAYADAHVYSGNGFTYLALDGTCTSACEQGTFLNTTAGACMQPRTCTMDDEYESAAPTATSDRECTPVTTCDEQAEFELTAPTATSDRICSALLPCDNGTMRDPANPAVCRQCQQGMRYDADAEACVPLAANEYEVRAVNGTTSEIRTCDCAGPCVRFINDTVDTVTCVPEGCAAGEIKEHFFAPDSTCTSCGPGHEIPTTGSFYGTCDMYTCPSSTYDHDSDPSTACRVCDAGSEIVTTGSTSTCVACAGNTTDDDYDASTPCVLCNEFVVGHAGPCSLVACQAGATLVAGLCVPVGCPPGEERVGGACQPCAGGHFSIGPRQPACVPHNPCSSGTYERAAPTATSDRVCQQCSAGCTCTATDETCPGGTQQSTGGSTASTSGSGTDYLPVGAGVGVGLILVSALVGLVIARKRRGSNKAGDRIAMTSSHNFDRQRPFYENSSQQQQQQQQQEQVQYEYADTPRIQQTSMGGGGMYEELDKPASENMYSSVRPDGRAPRAGGQDTSSIYASVDQQADVPQAAGGRHEGMDIYGSAIEDPSALYSVPVKTKKPEHPDGLIYADLKFVQGSAEGGIDQTGTGTAASGGISGGAFRETVRGQRPQEDTQYASVDQLRTLQAQQANEGGSSVLDQKEVEYQNVDEFA